MRGKKGHGIPLQRTKRRRHHVHPFVKNMRKLVEPIIIPEQVVSSLAGQKAVMANGPTNGLKSTALALSFVEGTQATLTLCDILRVYPRFHFHISCVRFEKAEKWQ